MYRRAQIWLRCALCLVLARSSSSSSRPSGISVNGLPAIAAVALAVAALATTPANGISSAAATSTSDVCLPDCMCISNTQMSCNKGGFHNISLPLPGNLEELSLSKNNFWEIPQKAFAQLRSLRKLELNDNNISQIKPFAFAGLSKLYYLSIQHTPLSRIDEFSFAALQNVSTILLARNKIAYIAGKAFAGSSQIKFIMLNDNPLQTIASNAFSGLTYVDNLVLSKGIANVEPDAFNGLEYVGFLKMTYMDLKAGLKPNTFRGLKHVDTLMIYTSDLGMIHKDAFAGLDQVNILTIMSNKVDKIEELRLNANFSVRQLRFHKNHVLLAPHPDNVSLHVDVLSVEENHFPCDCQLHLVLESDFVNGSAEEFRRRNFCISNVPELHSKPMSSIEPDSIARCHDTWTKDNYGSGVSIGSSALSFALLAFLYASRILLA